MSSRLKELRVEAGLTQAELAARAGVSRQLIGAVEAGRHLPRVDTALALATALGVRVEALFGGVSPVADVLTGTPPSVGALVRLGRVGDRLVAAPARVGSDGLSVADGVFRGRTVETFGVHRPGLVVAGCEPGLETLELLLRGAGAAAVAVSTSSPKAVEALEAGRVHAAVVHGPIDGLPEPRGGVVRFRLARWRVGIALPEGIPSDWWHRMLRGRLPVVQREPEAAVQRSFEAIVGRAVEGPRVGGHLAAARAGAAVGMPALTIEPAAVATHLGFHPLDVHEAQLWVDPEWVDDRAVVEAMTVINGRSFRRMLECVGGYDLEGCGSRL